MVLVGNEVASPRTEVKVKSWPSLWKAQAKELLLGVGGWLVGLVVERLNYFA